MLEVDPAIRRRLVLLLVSLAFLPASEAAAWPSPLVQALFHDAQRLLPGSLARLLSKSEREVIDEATRFPGPLSEALSADLTSGQLRPETLNALDAQAGEAVELIRQRRVTEGMVRLGALLRVPADVSDPALAGGPEGYPAGVVREYYAFVQGNLDKIPVVLDDTAALGLRRRDLPAYWQGLLGRSRDQAPLIRGGLFQAGRVVDHRTLDYRSPVFGVGSLAYSRAVTAIAATWLAVWRDLRGDLSRMPAAREIVPVDRPPARQDAGAPGNSAPSPEASRP